MLNWESKVRELHLQEFTPGAGCYVRQRFTLCDVDQTTIQTLSGADLCQIHWLSHCPSEEEHAFPIAKLSKIIVFSLFNIDWISRLSLGSLALENLLQSTQKWFYSRDSSFSRLHFSHGDTVPPNLLVASLPSISFSWIP